VLLMLRRKLPIKNQKGSGKRRPALAADGVRDGGQDNGHRAGPRNALARLVVDPEKRLVVVRFGKKVTAEDIEQYATRLRQHPLFNPSFSEIADLSAVEELDLQADEFLRLADAVDPFSHQAKRAFVVHNSVQAHAARMHKALRVDRSFSIFHSFEEAEQWINDQPLAASAHPYC